MKKDVKFLIISICGIVFVGCMVCYTITDSRYLLGVSLVVLMVIGLTVLVTRAFSVPPKTITYGEWKPKDWYANKLHHNDEPYVAYSGIEYTTQDTFDEVEDTEFEAFWRQCGSLN